VDFRETNLKTMLSRVAHACNPSYSAGRDQEDHSSKPAKANSSQEPVLKKTLHRKGAGEVAQGVGPEFKPQYHKPPSKKTHKNNGFWGLMKSQFMSKFQQNITYFNNQVLAEFYSSAFRE
jgi:hypothetical protein